MADSVPQGILELLDLPRDELRAFVDRHIGSPDGCGLLIDWAGEMHWLACRCAGITAYLDSRLGHLEGHRHHDHKQAAEDANEVFVHVAHHLENFEIPEDYEFIPPGQKEE